MIGRWRASGPHRSSALKIHSADSPSCRTSGSCGPLTALSAFTMISSLVPSAYLQPTSLRLIGRKLSLVTVRGIWDRTGTQHVQSTLVEAQSALNHSPVLSVGDPRSPCGRECCEHGAHGDNDVDGIG